ncbi:MAG: YhcN/YlaJ family sporulation lipoprotein [Peptococcaceae bacterium]|nr:YhcN/YlaJ family sporulation lipoprotein [Peptococcaceae bacterium]
MRTKKITALMLAVFLTLLLAAGCTSAARKPGPTPPGPAESPRTRDVLPTDPREANRLAERMADRATDVTGVRKATVVLSGTTAYVGLDLEPGVEGTRVKKVEKEVAGKVRKTDRRVDRVMVTTDPNTISRLKRISAGLAEGRPLSAFTKELKELNSRMTPVSE